MCYVEGPTGQMVLSVSPQGPLELNEGDSLTLRCTARSQVDDVSTQIPIRISHM